MKTIYIIRHAKSDQRFFGNDFERPLNERGRADAPMMAKRMTGNHLPIDALVSSPAIRAKMTAEFFAEEFKIPKDEIIFMTALYHAAADVFYEVIEDLPNELDAIALFSHNPGITYFVNSLDTATKVNNMSTCAVFAVSVDIDQWSAFKKAKKECLFLDYPKK